MPEISKYSDIQNQRIAIAKFNNFWATYGTKLCISSGISKSATTLNMALHPNEKQCITLKVFHADTTYRYSLQYL